MLYFYALYKSLVIQKKLNITVMSYYKKISYTLELAHSFSLCTEYNNTKKGSCKEVYAVQLFINVSFLYFFLKLIALCNLCYYGCLKISCRIIAPP